MMTPQEAHVLRIDSPFVAAAAAAVTESVAASWPVADLGEEMPFLVKLEPAIDNISKSFTGPFM